MNKLYCNLPEEGYETASRTVVHSQCLLLEKYSVRLIIIEVSPYTHCNFK